MALIKFRDGFTPTGNLAANYLQDQGLAHQTKYSPDSRARRNGDFINVTKPVGTDGFYSLGRITGAGTRVLGSPTARGRFSDRGPAPTSGGFITSQLGYYGRGLGSVMLPSEVGFFTNFDGKACFVFDVDVQRTRNGRRFVDHYAFSAMIPFGFEDTIYTAMRGGYRFNGTAHVFFAGQLFTGLDGDGQHLQVYVYDDGSTQTLGAISYLVNQLGWYADPLLLAPGVMVKMDRYVRPNYEITTVDVGACPGLVFTYTTDGGLTWANVSSTELFDDDMDTVRAIPAVAGLATKFNEAIAAAQITSAPLSRTLSVVLAQVPYIDVTAGPTYTVKVKVKLGLCDVAAGCSLTSTLTLYDGTPELAQRFGSRGLLGIPGGVLLFTRPITGSNDEWANPMRMQFTDDGIELADRGFMPQPEYKTGVISGFSKQVMVCPMYVDGEHALFHSGDYGLTWSKRAVIASNGIPPDDTPAPGEEQYSLADFPIITFLRDNDRAANAYPLTPWLNDSRQPDPPPI